MDVSNYPSRCPISSDEYYGNLDWVRLATDIVYSIVKTLNIDDYFIDGNVRLFCYSCEVSDLVGYFGPSLR